MATGRLGAVDLAATTNTTVYQVPVSKISSFTINVCNRNATSVKVRIALATTATPGVTEWLEYDTAVTGSGVLERSGLILDATKYVVAYSDTANVTVLVYGFEE